MRFGEGDTFKHFGAFVNNELRTVTGNRQVWGAFIETACCAGKGGCSNYEIGAAALTALCLESLPNMYAHSPQPNPALIEGDDWVIMYDRKLVESFEESPTAFHKRAMELICLHELLHWVIWKTGNHPKEGNESVIVSFEEKAYGKDRYGLRDAVNSLYFKRRPHLKGREDFKCRPGSK